MAQASVLMLEGRRRAAEFSGGTSADPIYAMIERVIELENFRGRLLDYGAGTGTLSRRLLELQRFDQVAAADIMRAPADLVGKISWLEQDLNLPMPCEDELFDVIVAAEVIEHLENPRFMMRELFRLLRRGGKVLVTTPNNESWRSLISLLVRGHFVAHDDSSYPAHITALLRKDLKRIFEEAGFDPPTFHFTDHGGFPGAPQKSWQQISFNTLRGLRYSDNLMAMASKPV